MYTLQCCYISPDLCFLLCRRTLPTTTSTRRPSRGAPAASRTSSSTSGRSSGTANTFSLIFHETMSKCFVDNTIKWLLETGKRVYYSNNDTLWCQSTVCGSRLSTRFFENVSRKFSSLALAVWHLQFSPTANEALMNYFRKAFSQPAAPHCMWGFNEGSQFHICCISPI